MLQSDKAYLDSIIHNTARELLSSYQSDVEYGITDEDYCVTGITMDNVSKRIRLRRRSIPREGCRRFRQYDNVWYYEHVDDPISISILPSNVVMNVNGLLSDVTLTNDYRYHKNDDKEKGYEKNAHTINYDGVQYEVKYLPNNIILLTENSQQIISAPFDSILSELIRRYRQYVNDTPIDVKKINSLPREIGLQYNRMIEQLNKTVEHLGFIDYNIGEYLLTMNETNELTITLP